MTKKRGSKFVVNDLCENCEIQCKVKNRLLKIWGISHKIKTDLNNRNFFRAPRSCAVIESDAYYLGVIARVRVLHWYHSTMVPICK